MRNISNAMNGLHKNNHRLYLNGGGTEIQGRETNLQWMERYDDLHNHNTLMHGDGCRKRSTGFQKHTLYFQPIYASHVFRTHASSSVSSCSPASMKASSHCVTVSVAGCVCHTVLVICSKLDFTSSLCPTAFLYPPGPLFSGLC